MLLLCFTNVFHYVDMIHQVHLFICALTMQVYYLKCSDQVGKIQNQHGRYHFLLLSSTSLLVF
jgi:hypothetical protein